MDLEKMYEAILNQPIMIPVKMTNRVSEVLTRNTFEFSAEILNGNDNQIGWLMYRFMQTDKGNFYSLLINMYGEYLEKTTFWKYLDYQDSIDNIIINKLKQYNYEIVM